MSLATSLSRYTHVTAVLLAVVVLAISSAAHGAEPPPGYCVGADLPPPSPVYSVSACTP